MARVDGAFLALPRALNQPWKFRFDVTALVKANDNVGFRVIYEDREGGQREKKKEIFARAGPEGVSKPLIARIERAFH